MKNSEAFFSQQILKDDELKMKLPMRIGRLVRGLEENYNYTCLSEENFSPL
jgi:hypothetical protein